MIARRPRLAGALSADELALWVEVTRSIAPLRPPRRKPLEPAPEAQATPPASTRTPPVAPLPAPAAPARAKPPPAFEPLGRRLRRDIHRGRFGVESALDLHGLREAQAHAALAGFIRDAQARGLRLVLVVTGKGRAGDGLLRRLAPHWLADATLRPLVVGFEEAGPTHGGAGALYVRLRRPGGGAP